MVSAGHWVGLQPLLVHIQDNKHALTLIALVRNVRADFIFVSVYLVFHGYEFTKLACRLQRFSFGD